MELYRNGWRREFEEAVSLVRTELTLAVPFIKAPEAGRICDLLPSSPGGTSPRVRLLTDLRADSALRGSLDIQALRLLHQRCDRAEITTLPNLHAKVYVFDRWLAVVSSANLTVGGLDANWEYGVGVRDPAFVERIAADINAYARLGSIVPPAVLEELSDVAAEAAGRYQRVLWSATREARRRFNASMARARLEFSRALVGRRSAQAIFREAILFALRNGPLATHELHPLVQQLLPDLCDDRVELIIDGERFGKAWKHHVRNAQQALKRTGLIRFDGESWGLSPS